MPLRPARRMRRGVIGAPVARTAATVGTAAVVVHGVRRRGDRREDRREDRRDDRRDTRQGSRDEKAACKAGDEKSRPECRKDKRDTKQDERGVDEANKPNE